MRYTSNPVTLGALAAALAGELRPLSAAGQVIENVASLHGAGEGSIVFAEDARSFAAACASRGAAVLVTAIVAARNDPDGLRGQPGSYSKNEAGSKAGSQAGGQFRRGERCPALLIVAQPKLAFARAAVLLRAAVVATGVHPQALVAASAELAPGVSVGPFAVVEEGAKVGEGTRIDAGAVIGAGCVLGPGCHIYPRVVLYPGVQLGARVVAHAGAVLGSDGFGYVRDAATGAYEQFPQQGMLIVEDDVEIGANTTIDRGALEETRIARGAKLDNLVHIGHNVQVGADVVIAAQTGVSGSSSIGARAIVAGQVGIADHVTIGEGAVLGAQCGVPSNKRIQGAGVLFWGTPARPITQYLKELAVLARLAKAGRKGRGSGASSEEG